MLWAWSTNPISSTKYLFLCFFVYLTPPPLPPIPRSDGVIYAKPIMHFQNYCFTALHCRLQNIYNFLHPLGPAFAGQYSFYLHSNLEDVNLTCHMQAVMALVIYYPPDKTGLVNQGMGHITVLWSFGLQCLQMFYYFLLSFSLLSFFVFTASDFHWIGHTGPIQP